MNKEDKVSFTINFGALCQTLFKPEYTLDQMFVEGKTAKQLFEELSGNLDVIGKIIYKDEWDGLKGFIKGDPIGVRSEMVQTMNTK